LEYLRAVCTEVSGCLVNDDGFTLTLSNEIYGIDWGTIFAPSFRAFLILLHYRRAAASSISPTEQEIQSIIPGEMPMTDLFPLDDIYVFLPH
jgi:hypothetical protein